MESKIKTRRNKRFLVTKVPVSELIHFSPTSVVEEKNESTIFHTLPNELIGCLLSYVKPCDMLILMTLSKSLKGLINPFLDKILCVEALSGRLSFTNLMDHKPLIDRIRQEHPDFEPNPSNYISPIDYSSGDDSDELFIYDNFNPDLPDSDTDENQGYLNMVWNVVIIVD